MKKLYSSSWPASVSQWHSHSGVVVLPCPGRDQKYTILCPYFCGSILGPYYSRQLTLSPSDPTPPPPPPPPPVTSKDILLSWVPSSLNAPTVPPPGTFRLFSPLPLPLLRIRLVPRLPALSAAVNLHWPLVSNGLQPMPDCPPPTLTDRAPRYLISLSPTFPVVVLVSWVEGGWGAFR